MTKRLFRIITLVAVLASLLTALLTTRLVYKELYEATEEGVIQQGQLLGQASTMEEIQDLVPLSNLYRVSVVSPSGQVLYDSKHDWTLQDNHLDRPEIKQALQGNTSTILRYSETYQQTSFYYTQLLKDGNVLRVSTTTKTIFGTMYDSMFAIVLFLLLLIPIILLLSRKLATSLVQPLNDISLEHPKVPEGYPELGPLVGKLESQQQTLEQQQEKLSSQKATYSLYLEKMREGFLLVDQELDILMVNTSGIALIGGSPEHHQGKHLLELTRNSQLHRGLEDALKGKTTTQVILLHHRNLQMYCNPIWEEGVVVAALCLLLDVTQEKIAEEQRKEFTANVSHELKTPLTSISGYAELLKNNLVQPEDISKIGERIHRQSSHMTRLVEDILQLSLFDEGTIYDTKESVDLYQLLSQIVQELQPLAKKKGLEFSLEGESALVEGVPSILQKVFQNLCHNALTYTQSGWVKVSVRQENGNGIVTVEDSGVGIHPEHQQAVFQRFYREDPSHSKSTGGTGLGLAIVKHGVEYHNGKITLSSSPHQGTKVTVYI